ncbi:MAG TPA: MotA/TolQ/ExbB proton channel family protein [Kiritimatiellia bacterium]|nr:MotA/TolQ/ExbB proton channel family protein [Kiritimatiellia bacterium]HSA19358.1 MotA/TolQ/ExbB proton channel family protein [Kiritimatiellia bacterium]
MAEEAADGVTELSEPELQIIKGARPSTDANVMIQLLVGVVGTLIVAFSVFPLKGHANQALAYIYALINQRGPIQYIELFMAWMVAAQIFLKSRILKKQSRTFIESPVDSSIDLNDDVHVQELRKRIVANPLFTESIALSRMDRILALWLATKDVGRISGWASSESDRDTSSSDSSYALSRVLIWAIPILGFIGTVQGLGSAVSGFADFLRSSAELSAIKGAIGNVTIGLGVAFDTTFLALMLVTFLMFPLSSLQRREETLFVEIDIYLDEVLISRLPSPESKPIVIENLEDSIEAAFRRYIPDPDRYDEVFTRSIEKAAASVEQKFDSLSQNYVSTLRGLSDHLSNSFGTVGDAMETALRKVTADLRAQEDAVLESRRKLAEEEAGRMKGVFAGVNDAVVKAANEYTRSADALTSATRESSEQSIQAARELVTRMSEVRQLASGIQDLFKIQQAMEKSLSGIAASAEFRTALEDLRKHLTTTDALVSRLSRPRVITLREETSG